MKSPFLFLVMATVLPFPGALEAQAPSSKTEYYTPAPSPGPGRAQSAARTPAPTTPRPAATPAPKTPHSAATPAPATPRPAATPAPTPALVKRENVNDIARFISGLAPEHDAQLATLAKTAEWTAYAAFMDNAWPRFDRNKLSRLRIWAGKELGKTRATAVFYPFSGPDFIYVANYFPKASTYILCGLEPVGDVPAMEKLQPLAVSLGWLQASFHTLFNAGYFVTSDMSVQLKASPLQGTLPLMCVMLARAGDRITSISTGPSVVEVRFVPPQGGERTLVYFSSDLSNGGFHKGSALVDYLAKTHATAAYVKSASYLMHEDEFSAVRNFLLTQFDTIVQDDSGIPLRNFDPARWKVALYGAYAKPLDIFAKYDQPDLADLYAKTKNVPPLNFGVGYHWDFKDANLMLATAKSGGPASALTPAVANPHR